jgi:tetratricopeptide (TPR) repeat protein
MANFFSSLFSSPAKEEVADGITKSDRKKFDILKYDGGRAQKIGKRPYASICVTEALLIQEDLETMSYLVGAYTMAHEPENALEVLNRMLEIEPDRLNALFSRVSVLFLLNKEEEVIRDCRHILTLEPTHPLAYFLMAKAKRSKGELDQAIEDVTQSIRLKEGFPEAYLLRSEMLLEKQEGDAALADVERVIECGGEEEEEAAFLLRGRIHSFLKKNAETESDFRKVLSLNPFHEDGALCLSELLFGLGRVPEALEVLDDLIELTPDSNKGYAMRARIREQNGDVRGSEEDRQKAEELQNAQIEQPKEADFSKLYEDGLF